MAALPPQTPASSSRILYDVPCTVCSDHSSGKHYGVFACDGCAGFFKRSVRRDRVYTCKARTPTMCIIDKPHRNQCRACRLAKCLHVGMNKDAVQHERGPRNATIRRHLGFYLKDPEPPANTGIGAPPVATASNQIIRPTPTIMPPPAIPVLPHCITPYPYNALSLINPLEFIRYKPPTYNSNIFMNSSDPESMCEAAAQILFRNVKWIRSIDVFDALSLQDMLVLLEESWKYLFMIGCAQFIPTLDFRLLCEGKKHLRRGDVAAFEHVLAEVVKVRLDASEYAALRAAAVFRISFSITHKVDYLGQVQDVSYISSLQEQARFILKQPYMPADQTRTQQIMRLILLLDMVPSQIIVELFFRNTIGDIPIERIIADMYKASKQTA